MVGLVLALQTLKIRMRGQAVLCDEVERGPNQRTTGRSLRKTLDTGWQALSEELSGAKGGAWESRREGWQFRPQRNFYQQDDETSPSTIGMF